MDPFSEAGKEKANMWSRRIIGAGIEVHRALGPGLLEAAYERCLCREFELQGIPFVRQKPVDIEYKGVAVESAFRIDLIVDDLVVIELKSIAKLDTVHEAHLLTYLRFSERWLGILMNFNVAVLKDGIQRIVR